MNDTYFATRTTDKMPSQRRRVSKVRYILEFKFRRGGVLSNKIYGSGSAEPIEKQQKLAKFTEEMGKLITCEQEKNNEK